MDRAKRERLREGLPVEVEPGIYGRINKEKRSLDLEDGSTIPIPAEKYGFYFPEGPKERRGLHKKESLQKDVESLPFGEVIFKAGEHSSVVQGLKTLADNFVANPLEAMSTQPGQENMSFFERLGENYAQNQAAYQSVSERISQESPISTALGAAGGIGLDLFATRGLSPAKGAGALALAGNLDQVASNPQGVAENVALSMAGGKAADKLFQGLSKVAGLRGARRQAAKAIADTEAANVAGAEANALSNKLQGAAVETERQNIMALNAAEKARIDGMNAANRQIVEDANLQARQNYLSQKAYNEASQNQYQTAKAAREQKVFELQQKDKQARAAWDAEVFAKEQEYKQAVQNNSATAAEYKRARDEAIALRKEALKEQGRVYQEELKAYQKELDLMPQLQREAQREYSANTLKAVEGIAKNSKGVNLNAAQLGVDEFIEDALVKSGRAGTREAKEAQGFLKSLFSKAETGTFGADDLVKSFKAIEDRIIRAGSAETRMILSEFKDFIGQRLPMAIGDSKVYAKIAPKVEKMIMNEVAQLSKGMTFPQGVAGHAKNFIQDSLKKLSPQEFAVLLKDGRLKEYLVNSLRNPPLSPAQAKLGGAGAKYSHPAMEQLANRLENMGDKIFRQYEREAFISYIDNQKALGGKIKKTQGIAPDVASPIPPAAPSPIPNPISPDLPPPPTRPDISPPPQPTPLPPPVNPPNLPPLMPPNQQKFIPQSPNMQPIPGKFVAQPFVPQAVPQMPQANTMTEKLAQGLEDTRLTDMLKSKSMTDNPIAKLAALKYVLGGAALPVEAGMAGGLAALKGLTSPTGAGQMSREALKKGMGGLIDSMAQRYSSYRNGILDSPMERRSLVKEIEENPNMRLEDKAVFQSKINRGEPLFKDNQNNF